MDLPPEKKIAGVLAPLFALRHDDDLGIGDTEALRQFIEWVADAGFTLARGSEAQMSAVRAEDAFERLITRASLIVHNVGVVDAALGDGLEASIGVYQAAVSDLT